MERGATCHGIGEMRYEEIAHLGAAQFQEFTVGIPETDPGFHDRVLGDVVVDAIDRRNQGDNLRRQSVEQIAALQNAFTW